MDIPDCNSRDCSFCSQIRAQQHVRSGKAARDRLSKLINERMNGALKPPVITETFDWEYQEWVDSNLSLGGR